MAIDKPPEGVGRIEKIIIYTLLLISTALSAASLYVNGVRSNQLEEGRLDIESSVLELTRQSYEQTAALNEVELSVREQDQSRNAIDQRMKLLELIQRAQPNIEAFPFQAENTANLGSVNFCFKNHSAFTSHIAATEVVFREIGALGQIVRELDPYIFGEFDGIGEIMPENAVADRLNFRIRDFDRASKGFQVSVSFLYSVPSLVESEIRSIASELEIKDEEIDFTFRFTSTFGFFGGYFDEQTYRDCV